MDLITCLLGSTEIKVQFPKFRDLPDWTTRELLAKKEVFLQLVEYGAEYKHSLTYFYAGVSVFNLNVLLSTYGKDALAFPASELTYLAQIITTRFDKNAFTKLGLFLDFGADINAPIDAQYKSTLLHYLIALGLTERAIVLIVTNQNL
ncbi:MAG: hypothetical protein ACRCXC_10860 [Legionella sp.]